MKKQKRKNAKTQKRELTYKVVDLSTAPAARIDYYREFLECDSLKYAIKALQKIRRDKLAALRRKENVRKK